MKQKCEASEELKKIPGLVKKVRTRYNDLVKAGLIKPNTIHTTKRTKQENAELIDTN